MKSKNPSSPDALHHQFKEYGKNARKWIEACKQLLLEIDKHRVWEKKGYTCIYEYAAKLACLSCSQVDDALWVLRKIEDKPALKAVVVVKGIASVRPVVTISQESNEEFWAEKAKELSRNALRAYVKEFRTQNNMVADKGLVDNNPIELANSLQGKSWAGPENKSQIELPEEIALCLRQLQKRKDFNDKMKAFMDAYEEEVNAAAPEPVKSDSRYIPVKIQKHVLNSTDGICAFPDCNKPYHQLHHTQRFSLERVHDPTRLHPLCKAHNEIAHQGLILNEEGPPHTWKIRSKPDQTHPKYFIDQQVNMIRHNAVLE